MISELGNRVSLQITSLPPESSEKKQKRRLNGSLRATDPVRRRGYRWKTHPLPFAGEGRGEGVLKSFTLPFFPSRRGRGNESAVSQEHPQGGRQSQGDGEIAPRPLFSPVFLPNTLYPIPDTLSSMFRSPQVERSVQKGAFPGAPGGGSHTRRFRHFPHGFSILQTIFFPPPVLAQSFL